nr:unnamed protein product [Callosobruchus chinensis]
MSNLTCQDCVDEKLLSKQQLEWILPNNYMTLGSLKSLPSIEEPESEIIKRLDLLSEQIDLALKVKRNYSPKMILWAFMVYMQSSSSYMAIRETKYLLDEIYINSKIKFKNSKVRGFSENHPDIPAKTIQVFLNSSAYGHFKEIVTLHPFKNITGEQLYKLTKSTKVLYLIISCEFYVLAIILDNNRYYEKPFVFPPFKYFLGTQLVAKFSDVRKFYNSKCRNGLLQPGYRLNYSTVYPSNLKRQKVQLVCNLFYEETYCALKAEFEKESGVITSQGTFIFIKIILGWWTIATPPLHLC